MNHGNLKIFISADMEGIAGVAHGDEVTPEKKDYELFRKIMTEEVNAAIEASFESGASEVIVRDGHSMALNILPDLLHKEAKLLRKWSGGPMMMMEGIDRGFDAVLFIGYHAKAHTPNAVLKHTINQGIADLRINGKSMAELTVNALVAGSFDVPVVFVSGDRAVCDFAESELKRVVTVAVKEGIGKACLTIQPEKARELIKKGVKDSLKNTHKILPYRLDPPYKFEISYNNEDLPNKNQWYPGAKREDKMTVSYEADDILDGMRFLMFCMS